MDKSTESLLGSTPGSPAPARGNSDRDQQNGWTAPKITQFMATPSPLIQRHSSALMDSITHPEKAKKEKDANQGLSRRGSLRNGKTPEKEHGRMDSERNYDSKCQQPISESPAEGDASHEEEPLGEIFNRERKDSERDLIPLRDASIDIVCSVIRFMHAQTINGTDAK
jgi:hypothetical protein